MVRLGVNIDHVATLRQARGEPYPSVVDAAYTCLDHGADQITIHLREDRRHIQDTDVEAVHLVTKKFGKPLNLEIGVAPEIVDIAMATRPDWICVVPENREEKTTEGGLDLLNPKTFEKVKAACEKLKANDEQLKISLFVEANEEVLRKCAEINCDAVEIHTGDYARAHLNGEDIASYIEQYERSKSLCAELGLGHHAGHGLTGQSVKELVEKNLFVEYNIGNWIICQSVFDGLSKVVENLKEELQSK
ncbi:MAG: pyridoxine 5'-phosphate synthase [Halobacteriovoraceae bacterium]|nr:pyridoxine 5'-phosphate synthase [Halobacteriovoraceae bacterium]